jgi:hypothetical protein
MKLPIKIAALAAVVAGSAIGLTTSSSSPSSSPATHRVPIQLALHEISAPSLTPKVASGVKPLITNLGSCTGFKAYEYETTLNYPTDGYGVGSTETFDVAPVAVPAPPTFYSIAEVDELNQNGTLMDTDYGGYYYETDYYTSDGSTVWYNAISVTAGFSFSYPLLVTVYGCP